MGIEEITILAIAGGIGAIIQHGQTLFEIGGIKIPSAWKRLIAGALSFVAVAVVILVGEQEGGELSSHSLTDWFTSFVVAFGASQAVFANVLPKIGLVSKE